VSDLYAVFRESSLGREEVEVFESLESAVEYADREDRDAETSNTPVVHTVYEMRALPDAALWDWGHRSPDGRVIEYVHQRAARNALPSNRELVRRRKGGDVWEVAPDA
jgi:hypothetical protein